MPNITVTLLALNKYDLETVEEFLAHWQIKRDQTQRGIVEIVEEETHDMQ